MLRECATLTFHESSGNGYYLDFHEPDGTRFYLSRNEVKRLIQNILRVAGNDIIFNADDSPEFKGGELHEPMG